MRLSAKFIMALSIMAGVLFSGVMGEFSAWASDDPCDNKGIEGINLLMITHGGQETSLIGIQEDDPGAFTIGSFTHTDSTVHYESDLILLEIVGECVPDDVSLETTMKLDLLPSAGEGGDSDRITLWEDQTKTTSLPLPAIFSLQEISSGKRLWIEAATPSKSQGDITICAKLIDPEDTSDETTCQDTVNATAVSVRLREVSFETGFILTKQSLENLRNEGLPDEILEGLQSLEGQEFPGKDEFLDAIEKHIGSDQTVKYKELILKHASGNDNLVVTADPRPEDEELIRYTAPHWKDSNLNGKIESSVNPHDPTDSNNERQFPVVSVRDSTMRITATFALAPEINTSKRLWIRATGPPRAQDEPEKTLDIPATAATISGNTATIEKVECKHPFADTVALFNPLEFSWEYALEPEEASTPPESEERWASAGKSQNQVYVTFDTPETTAEVYPEQRPIYHTLVHLGCDAANGEDFKSTVLDRIWETFAGLAIRRIRPDGQEGEMLTYYGKRENTDIEMTAQLLQKGDGPCDAWARLFIDTLKIQGLKYTTGLIRLKYPYGWWPIENGWFLVKNWEFTPNPRASDPEYPYENVKDEPWIVEHPSNIPDYSLHWKSTDVIDQPGIEAQGKDIIPNPHSIFSYHVVVYISTTDEYNPALPHYDPTYGKRYYHTFSDALKEMDKIVAGYGYLDTPLFGGDATFYFKQNFDDFNVELETVGRDTY